MIYAYGYVPLISIIVSCSADSDFVDINERLTPLTVLVVMVMWYI